MWNWVTCVSERASPFASSFRSCPTMYGFPTNAFSSFSSCDGENAVRTRFRFGWIGPPPPNAGSRPNGYPPLNDWNEFIGQKGPNCAGPARLPNMLGIANGDRGGAEFGGKPWGIWNRGLDMGPCGGLGSCWMGWKGAFKLNEGTQFCAERYCICAAANRNSSRGTADCRGNWGPFRRVLKLQLFISFPKFTKFDCCWPGDDLSAFMKS